MVIVKDKDTKKIEFRGSRTLSARHGVARFLGELVFLVLLVFLVVLVHSRDPSNVYPLMSNVYLSFCSASSSLRCARLGLCLDVRG